MLHPLDDAMSVGVIVAIAGPEAHQDLIEYDLIDHLDVVGRRQLFGETARQCAAALHQLCHALTSERPEGRVYRESAGSSRVFWVVVEGVALARRRYA